MARLFASAVVRDPEAAPPGWIDRRLIHTHPGAGQQQPPATPAAATAAAARPDKRKTGPAPGEPGRDAAASWLHDRLFAAWQAKDWNGLVGIARDHLGRSGPDPKLHPVAAAALAFFRPGEVRLREGDAERFLARFPEGQLAEYLQREHDAQRSRIADDALALHCLGLLGSARFDYLGALRSLEALTTSARLWQPAEPGPRISPAQLDEIGSYEVALPGWGFEIEVCRRSDSDEGWPRESPLERKIAQVRRRETVRLSDEFCECAPAEPACTPQDPCCAEVHYYIADLLELRDWPHRYKPGDIAYIEVQAPGETRSRTHVMERTLELLTETETSERSLETRDLQVTDRSELKVEIERQQEQKISAEATTTGTYDNKLYMFTATVSGSFSRTTSEAVREAQENAIETVKKAVSEIEKKTSVKRSERLTTKETETNVHAFSNVSEHPFVTQYFWVNQERRAQLYSYGKRVLAEFIVPEPARLYERLVEQRREAAVRDGVRPPPGDRPDRPLLKLKATDLTETNYKSLCDDWGVKDAPAFPPPTKQITLWEGTVEEIADQHELNTRHFDVPAGYVGISIRVVCQVSYRTTTGGWFPSTPSPQKLRFSLPGGNAFDVTASSDDRTIGYSPALTGGVDVYITSFNTTHVDSWTTLNLVRQPEALEAWQKAVLGLIRERYEAALAAYVEKMKPWDAYDAACDARRRELQESERSRNPFFNRELERAELKRAVIYLMCQDFSVDGAMIRNAEPCGNPEIDRTAADRKGYDWYFWDLLIDWKLMAYAFFDYFWNPMCDWPERFDPDEPDALFKAFRRAGYARVIVPINPGMEGDFLWYVKTHQKWGPTGKPGFGPNDPRWRNVVYELGHANASAMTPREGRVEVDPTKSVVILKGSDRYWDPGLGTPTAGVGTVDGAAITLDVDREIYIEGEVYLITAIALSTAAGAPQFDPAQPNSMWWDLTLDRLYVGPAGSRLYGMGAQAVAPVFSFDVPTELIWAGEKNKCLPTYPLPACVE